MILWFVCGATLGTNLHKYVQRAMLPNMDAKAGQNSATTTSSTPWLIRHFYRGGLFTCPCFDGPRCWRVVDIPTKITSRCRLVDAHQVTTLPCYGYSHGLGTVWA